MKENTCCFIAHRTINETEELRNKLSATIEKLSTDEKADTFLFGNKSRFDSLCLSLIRRDLHPADGFKGKNLSAVIQRDFVLFIVF